MITRKIGGEKKPSHTEENSSANDTKIQPYDFHFEKEKKKSRRGKENEYKSSSTTTSKKGHIIHEAFSSRYEYERE